MPWLRSRSARRGADWVFVAGPVTGGAVNPVRALGPMLVSGSLTDWWLYLVGPIVGGVVAAVVYDRFVRKADSP